ncbi:MAG: FAD-dependent oxidoreductase [Cyclobacteriaceae bacterium]
MKKTSRRVAILGAGGAGVCAALELAQRGYDIDLYESSSLPISKASYVNEGKIHLGFIYAMDRKLKTSREMIVGALHFVSNLKRWIDLDPEEVISTPFNYCVHNDSLVDASELLGHYKNCMSLFDEAKDHCQLKYLDLFESIQAKRMSDADLEKIANPEYIKAGFSTNEYAVEPRTIAEKLRDALNNEPSINLLLNTPVQMVFRKGSQVVVHFRNGNTTHMSKESYTDVINVSWNGRLKIDKSMGISPPAGWS